MLVIQARLAMVCPSQSAVILLEIPLLVPETLLVNTLSISFALKLLIFFLFHPALNGLKPWIALADDVETAPSTYYLTIGVPIFSCLD